MLIQSIKFVFLRFPSLLICMLNFMWMMKCCHSSIWVWLLVLRCFFSFFTEWLDLHAIKLFKKPSSIKIRSNWMYKNSTISGYNYAGKNRLSLKIHCKKGGSRQYVVYAIVAAVVDQMLIEMQKVNNDKNKYAVCCFSFRMIKAIQYNCV